MECVYSSKVKNSLLRVRYAKNYQKGGIGKLHVAFPLNDLILAQLLFYFLKFNFSIFF